MPSFAIQRTAFLQCIFVKLEVRHCRMDCRPPVACLSPQTGV